MDLLMSYQSLDFDKMQINWSQIDSHLMDMLIPALNSNTQLTLFNCNSLSEADVEILEDLFQFLFQFDIKAIEYLEEADLIFYASEEFEDETINDLSLILRLINSFSRLLNKSKAIIKIWNATFQDFQLFSIAKESMNYIIQFEEWKIKLPQNKLKLNHLSKIIDLNKCEYEGKSMLLLYNQLLKMLGENNYHSIYRLKNFIIFSDSYEELNMLDYLWNKINKRNLVYNLLMLEIMALIKDIEKYDFFIKQKI